MATQVSSSVPDVVPPPSSGVATTLRRTYQSYTLRLIARAIITVWAVITFTFFLVRLMPGNPVDVYIQFLMNQQNLTYQEAQQQAASIFRFDTNASLATQYVEYMGQLAHGDLGQSIVSTGTQVIDQILQFLPWTL